ncbi:MAG TPA: hypothetical protein VFT91_01570, partial [Dehalococcoidia bacterium]|nr:hypothetical protein [Dehalococcoidia bacterium]
MIYALSVGAMTLVATAIAGGPFVGALRRFKVGKEISEWGPEAHQAKAGTPTMGGVLIVAAVGVFTLAANLIGRWSIGLPLAVIGALALLGFVDDLGSLQGRPQRVLNKRVKLAAFLAIGLAAAFGLFGFTFRGPRTKFWERMTITGVLLGNMALANEKE